MVNVPDWLDPRTDDYWSETGELKQFAAGMVVTVALLTLFPPVVCGIFLGAVFVASVLVPILYW